MPRLLLVDDDSGRLALLAAGMLTLEGAPGFSEVVPCALAAPSTDPLPAACLAEVGLLLPPVLHDLSSLPRGAGDVLLSLGLQPHPEALAHLPSTLPPDDAPPLARRAGARIARDQLARRLAVLLPALPPRG
jgi:hypothetical protein